MATGQNPSGRGSASNAESAAARGDEPPGSQRHDDLPNPFLDQVMSETASQLAEPAQLDPRVRAELVEVARRFAGQPLVLDPTGVALLEALLAAEFPLFAERPALLAKAARQVAEALLADPGSHRRLEHLWQTLGEEAA
jgi:hypothetical protein